MIPSKKCAITFECDSDSLFFIGMYQQTGNPGLPEADPQVSLSPWSLLFAGSAKPEEENKPAAEQHSEANGQSCEQWVKAAVFKC